MIPTSGAVSMDDLRTEFGYSGEVGMYTFYINRYTCRGIGGYDLNSWRGYVHAPCYDYSITMTFTTGAPEDICSLGSSVLVYGTGTYGLGSTLYTDSGLSSPVSTGYTYVSGPDALIRYISYSVVGWDSGVIC